MYSNNNHDELEPRPMPKPTQFQEISAKPEVPELSVVFNSSGSNLKPSNGSPIYTTSQAPQETYSEWKNRQIHSPAFKETLNHGSHDKHYYRSSTHGDSNQNPYNRFSDKMPCKSEYEYHKCTCQNTPTVKDIYNMMQIQNDQIKFLLETIQKLLVTVLSNQQNQNKCCCFENDHCKKGNGFKTTEVIERNETQEESTKFKKLTNNHAEKSQENFKKDKVLLKTNEPNSAMFGTTSVTKDKLNNSKITKCDNFSDEKNMKKEKERTYSIVSDESFDLNANDVQVVEAPVSPEQSIHIEMKLSSDDSSNSEHEEENDKQIEVGWTMYKNIIGQVNNLLEDNKSELKSETIAKPVECEKPTQVKPKNFESYKHFMLPENGKIDSSLQMQALAMQYLSPEQAVKFDMNKHFVPAAQPLIKSPNNYSISTLHYMERYHLIGTEQNLTTENPQQNDCTEGLLNKKKKSSRKNKTPSKILNITELKQQPKLS